MASPTLTMATHLVCPHQGQVQVIPSQFRVRVDGHPVLTSGDTMTIAGCPFMRGTQPSPCVDIEWTTSDMRCSADQKDTLSEASIGICMSADGTPQGQVIVQQNQRHTTTE